MLPDSVTTKRLFSSLTDDKLNGLQTFKNRNSLRVTDCNFMPEDMSSSQKDTAKTKQQGTEEEGESSGITGRHDHSDDK